MELCRTDQLISLLVIFRDSRIDEQLRVIPNMSQKQTWNKIVHAPFKKVIKFDLICMALGIVMGMGVGAFIVAGL